MGVLDIFERFKAVKLQSHMQVSKKRSENLRNRAIKQQRLLEIDIGKFLRQEKEEKARIKAELLWQQQKQETAMDLIETYLDLLVTRIKYIEDSKECPPDLVMPIATIVYAEKRAGIPELKNTCVQLGAKFGRSFCHQHADNMQGDVNPKIIDFLNISPPREFQINELLQGIANKQNIDWVAPRLLPRDIPKNNFNNFGGGGGQRSVEGPVDGGSFVPAFSQGRNSLGDETNTTSVAPVFVVNSASPPRINSTVSSTNADPSVNNSTGESFVPPRSGNAGPIQSGPISNSPVPSAGKGPITSRLPEPLPPPSSSVQPNADDPEFNDLLARFDKLRASQ